MRTYQQTSLKYIQRWSDLPPDVPLFESIIRFQNFPIDPSLQTSNHDATNDEPLSVDWWHYPLCLIVETSPTLTLVASYTRSRFDEAAVITMLAELRDLLEYMAASLSHGVEHQASTKTATSSFSSTH